MSETAQKYVTALDRRDWVGLAALLSEDVEYLVAQTGERVLGRANVVSFNRRFPGNWSLQLVRSVGNAGRTALEMDFTDAGETQRAVVWLEHPAGVIAHITDYWPDPYDPPAFRADWPEIASLPKEAP